MTEEEKVEQSWRGTLATEVMALIGRTQFQNILTVLCSWKHLERHNPGGKKKIFTDMKEISSVCYFVTQKAQSQHSDIPQGILLLGE